MPFQPQLRSRGDRRLFVVSGPDGTTDQFWSLDFQSTSVGGELLRVCYAWSVGEGWTAPNDVRFAFAGSPYLYKIQVSTLLHAGKRCRKTPSYRSFCETSRPRRGHTSSRRGERDGGIMCHGFEQRADAGNRQCATRVGEPAPLVPRGGTRRLQLQIGTPRWT